MFQSTKKASQPYVRCCEQSLGRAPSGFTHAGFKGFQGQVTVEQRRHFRVVLAVRQGQILLISRIEQSWMVWLAVSRFEAVLTFAIRSANLAASK